MNRLVILFFLLTTFTVQLFAQEGTMSSKKKKKGKPVVVEVPAGPLLKTEKDSVSYGIGVQIGSSLKKDGLDTLISFDLLQKGLEASFKNDSSMIFNADSAYVVLSTFFRKLAIQKMEAERLKGIQFLAETKLKPGVKSTPSGLLYEVISEGPGEKPQATSLVKVNYKGMHINGEVFDSTEGQEPAEFPLNRVIPGWTEGIQLMKAGSKFKLYIPSDLAYGEQGAQQAGIGPNEVLVFEVELIGFK